METTDPTFRALHADAVRKFFANTLPKLSDQRQETVLGLYDMDLPEALWQGMSSVPDVILSVSGKRPWMELCGPSVVGDVRFVPGCGLFWNGNDVTGDFQCSGALNLLPLGNEFDEEPYRRLLDLGRFLSSEPLDLHIENGRLSGIDSAGKLATNSRRSSTRTWRTATSSRWALGCRPRPCR
jgi:hypothetical protein